MLAFCVAQRHAQVTFDPPFNKRLVIGELELYPGRVMAQVAPNHVLARGAHHVPLDIFGDPVPKPKRQRARPRPPGELGDESITRSDRCCQVPDKGLKVRLPGVGGGPLDDRAQSGSVVGGGGIGIRRCVVHQAAPLQVMRQVLGDPPL